MQEIEYYMSRNSVSSGTPSLRLGRQVPSSSPRALDLDLTQPALVEAYRVHTTGHLPSLPATNSQVEAATAHQSFCLDSAAWLQKQGGRKATKSSGTTLRRLVRQPWRLRLSL